MSHGSAWQREALAIKQVPTLRKLLRCCDEGLLVRTILEEHAYGAAGGQPLAPKRRRAAERRLSATLTTMRGLPLGKGGQTLFLLPEESFVLHARSGCIERRLSATLLAFDDVERARDALEARGGAGGEADEELAEEGLLRRSYALSSWEDVLAYRVWLGGPWCTRERYLVLASAFWEMTYLGFEHDRVRARQSQEKARRMLEGCASPAPNAQQSRTEAYGLDEPDRFSLDYRDRLASRVSELNRACRKDVLARFLDLAARMEAA